MTSVKRIFPNKLGLFCIVTFFVTFLIVQNGKAVAENNEKANVEVEDLELNFEVIERDYEYRIENRPDPFIPFYTGETTSQEPDPNEIVETKERLTGMQLFEPGQLTLVALMEIEGQYIAMVEDFKGQGYIIHEGTKIGRRGTVKDIRSNKVLIEEVAVTRAGQELRSEIVMALRKEGEE